MRHKLREYTIRGTNNKIRYNDFSGALTPIIFIHGLGCAGSFDYVEVISHMQSKHRIMLIDLLDAGYSDKHLLTIRLIHMLNT